MFKFIKGKGQHVSAERQKLQKELFAFNKTVPHGFPHRPSSLAWDPKLRLVGVGTRSGLVRVYGTPGVEFHGEHENECAVRQLLFVPNQGRLISLCSDNTLHLWEINVKGDKSLLEEVKSCTLEESLKATTCCLHSSGEILFIGLEDGNIMTLDVKEFKLNEDVIKRDDVAQNVPDDYKVNPGAVEVIAEQPSDADKILIGYNRGLLVLWDSKTLTPEHTYVGSQQLESVSWHRTGTQFMSAHNDGSYMVWNVTDSSKPAQAPHTPYGPFPCKAIGKILWRSVKGGDNVIVFAGGMPRASHGDRHTVTVMQGSKHQVLDFTSKVVDFFTISDVGDEAEFENPHSLVVLVEEELVVIDLESEGWLPYRLPYMTSIHSSAITCSHHCSDVPQELWDKIVAAGNKQVEGKYSDREWPVNGGRNLTESSSSGRRDLLLTGHEDGTVRFWDASGVAMNHLYTLHTACYFTGEDHEQSTEAEDWPPFRKVGNFDPYSDDPRLAVKKIVMCVLSGTLVVAGTAGQVIIMELKGEEVEKEVEESPVNIVGDRDNFVWKGHEKLTMKTDPQKLEQGFQPMVVMQLAPPAAVTALALHAEWGLVAAGTAHGFGLFDYFQKKPVISKCTLNPNDMAAAETPMSRRKSLKKSLRESFRRLRKGRSQRGKKEKTPTRSSSEESKQSSPKETPVTDLDAPGAQGDAPASPIPSPPLSTDSKPVERQVEARSAEDALGSMVRCLYIAQTHIINNTLNTPTLWAGTNSGAIYVFTISLPTNEKRDSEPVTCHLGKEIQLKHRAPVIAIQIVDYTGYPLPDPLEIQHQKAKAPSTAGNHRVLICSEEQFKVFTLPSLKPFCKFKLTAHEGSRVRKIGIVKFTSRSDESYSEFCVTCLSNQGDLSTYTIPDLRRQTNHSCIKREDINGISSLVFARNGEGFFQHSPCEFQRFSLSARCITESTCAIDLPEGARPEPPAEEVVVGDDTLEVESVNKEETKSSEDKDTKEVTENEISNVVEHITLNDSTAKESIADETFPAKSPDVSAIQEEEKSNLDITVDSVRDHLTALSEEKTTTIIETKEESKFVKTQERVLTVTSTTLTNETIVNSTGETEEAPSCSQAQGPNSSTECPAILPEPAATSSPLNETKKAPIAIIDELNPSEERCNSII